jgi:hypothetical protein
MDAQIFYDADFSRLPVKSISGASFYAQIALYSSACSQVNLYAALFKEVLDSHWLETQPCGSSVSLQKLLPRGDQKYSRFVSQIFWASQFIPSRASFWCI